MHKIELGLLQWYDSFEPHVQWMVAKRLNMANVSGKSKVYVKNKYHEADKGTNVNESLYWCSAWLQKM
jgi:hypothetical protein